MRIIGGLVAAGLLAVMAAGCVSTYDYSYSGYSGYDSGYYYPSSYSYASSSYYYPRGYYYPRSYYYPRRSYYRRPHGYVAYAW